MTPLIQVQMTKTQKDILRFMESSGDAAIIYSLVFGKARVETGDYWEGETVVHRWITHHTLDALKDTGRLSREQIHNGYRYTLKDTLNES